MVTTQTNQLENPDGFLIEMTSWTRDIAADLAKKNDLGPLSDDHWKVIDFVRDYYHEYGEGPPIIKIGKSTGFSSRFICEMFPCGIAKGAYRIAGLPRPAGCL